MYNAQCRLTSNGRCVVLAGSTIKPEEAISIPYAAKMAREELLAGGVIDRDNTFVVDWTFDNPKAAAEVIGGYKVIANVFWEGLEEFTNGGAK